MSFQSIRSILKTKLESIDSIQEVSDYPNEEFGGFPAAVIKSTRNDSEFETTTENQRVYVFTVFLVQEIESKKVRQTRRIIEGVVDDVIDELDKDQGLSGISLDTNKTMVIMRPALAGIIDDPQYTTAELEISVVISFNINT